MITYSITPNKNSIVIKKYKFQLFFSDDDWFIEAISLCNLRRVLSSSFILSIYLFIEI